MRRNHPERLAGTIILDHRRQGARRPSDEMDAHDVEAPSRRNDESAHVMDLLTLRQVTGGIDAGSQVRAGYSERAREVAAMIRVMFMVDEEIEFVSRQGNNIAAYALLVFLQQEIQTNVDIVQQHDNVISGEETARTPARKTLFQVCLVYLDNRYPVPDTQ